MTYYARELTDPAGGALTIATDHQGLWITATEGREEVTVGPFPATTLVDDMDGGVAAALIEKEVAGSYTRTDDDGLTLLMVQQQRDQATARAEKAEKERDEAVKSRDALAGAHEHQAATIGQLMREADRPRPLTADGITAEMERRLIRKGVEFAWFSERDINDRDTRDKVRALLAAALTGPTRPEGAESVSSVLGALRDGDGEWMTYASDKDLDGLADAMAERGVRVTGAES